jgi:hypothetical protein
MLSLTSMLDGGEWLMPHTSHFTAGNDPILPVSEAGPYSKNATNYTSITVNAHTAWDGSTSNEARTNLFHNNSSLCCLLCLIPSDIIYIESYWKQNHMKFEDYCLGKSVLMLPLL